MDFISSWVRGYAYDISSRNLAVFCLCPENLHGAESTSKGLIALVEETSKQNNMESVGCLLLFKCMQWGGRKHQEAEGYSPSIH